MLRLKGTAATVAGTAPTLGDAERPGILHCMGSKVLLSTSKGRVLVRGEDDTWTAKTIDAKPPKEIVKTSPGARPAKTR